MDGWDDEQGNCYQTQRDATSLDGVGYQNGIGTGSVSYHSPMGYRKEQNQGPQSLCLSMCEEKSLEITSFIFVSNTFDNGSTSPGTLLTHSSYILLKLNYKLQQNETDVAEQ